MKNILVAFGMLAFALGLLIVFSVSASAIHEIEGLILVLISAVLLSASAIVHAANRVEDTVRADVVRRAAERAVSGG
jgi:hypothetical protein